MSPMKSIISKPNQNGEGPEAQLTELLTKGGAKAIIENDTWILRGGRHAISVRLDWTEFPLRGELAEVTKEFMRHVIRSKADSSIRSVWNGLLSPLRGYELNTGGVEQWKSFDWPQVSGILGWVRTKGLIGYWPFWKLFLQWIGDVRPDLVTEDVLHKVRSIKVLRPALMPVRNMDPQLGPLDEVEFANFIKGVWKSSTLPLEGKVVLILVGAFGLRPASIAMIREDDFVSEKIGGNEWFRLKVHLVKQRYDDPRRNPPIEIGLETELARLIGDLIQQNRNRFETKVGDFRPLIFRAEARSRVEDPFRWHWNYDHLSMKIRVWCNEIPVISSRTNTRRKVSAQSLRYTFGTLLANRGVPMTVLARKLGHTSLNSAKHYYRIRSDQDSLYNRLVDQNLGEIIDRYSGRLVDQVSPARAIFAQSNKAILEIGECGSKRQCRLDPPLSCYGCEYLVALKSRNHLVYLQQLQDRKRRLLETGRTGLLLAAQLDSAIHGVQAVVEAIELDGSDSQ
ncbi:hypothetical protein GETHLI_34190 [Geothrix limicola]|uniref:Tyr recombinase domain-containing protein n=1 Tax=Geothrix limicola TaxID=2927978 RepID=A0ABQ5QJ48_9BACT|nr:site-specific integrase [Geothrix limicola]GLH74917.1 hypothetical protein GETHLI_34190 [Geothrix limicola]